MDPAVHAVDDADELRARVLVAQQHGAAGGVGEIQLEVHRLEIRAAQLRGRVQHDAPRVGAQAREEMAETLALLPEAAELFFGVALDRLLGDRFDLVVVHGGKAPAALDLARGLFKHVVEEAADLDGSEARALARFGAEPVLAEVGVFAGGEFVDLRGAQTRDLAVERLYRLSGETAAAQHGGAAKAFDALRRDRFEVFLRGAGAPVPGGVRGEGKRA